MLHTHFLLSFEHAISVTCCTSEFRDIDSLNEACFSFFNDTPSLIFGGVFFKPSLNVEELRQVAWY